MLIARVDGILDEVGVIIAHGVGMVSMWSSSCCRSYIPRTIKGEKDRKSVLIQNHRLNVYPLQGMICQIILFLVEFPAHLPSIHWGHIPKLQ